LLSNPYYQGSLFLNWCQDQSKRNHMAVKQFKFRPLPGFKTDTVGSRGIEYLDLSEQEDIVVKYGMLASNGILLPTLSDKTTYGAIFGSEEFKAFGIDFTKTADDQYMSNLR